MSFKWFVAALSLLTGCSTSATITARYGGPVNGEIVGSDWDSVFLEGPSGPRTVPRSDIQDIDHPGNVAAVIGGVVAAYGVANIAIGAPQCEDQGAAFCTGVFIPAAVGLSIMTWGIATYAGSVSALNDGSSKKHQGRVFVLPTDKFAGQPNTPGLTVGSTF